MQKDLYYNDDPDHEFLELGWYFWDEASQGVGPYSSREDAWVGREKYKQWLEKPKYNRVEQWTKFSDQVHTHIWDYTLEQYGSTEGTEQIDNFTIEDCYQNMMRYINRRKSNTRGNKERLRDVIKIAHYASFIYDKLKEELGEEDVY
jgi:hypothetical protein